MNATTSPVAIGREYDDETGIPAVVVVDRSAIRASLRGSACGHPRAKQAGLGGCSAIVAGARRRMCGSSYSTIEDETERQQAEREQAYRLAVGEFPLPYGWTGAIYVREADGSERKVY